VAADGRAPWDEARASNKGIRLARSRVQTSKRATVLIAVFASAAEAKHTEKTIHDVWTSYAADSDVKGAFSAGFGLSTAEIEVLIEEAKDRAVALIQQPQIQSAIYALADALPNAGKLPGKRAGQIIARALSSNLSTVD
jgi:hypothetical protein